MKKYFLIAILSLAASATVIIFLVFPAYDRIVVLRMNITEKKEIIGELDRLILKLDQWRGQIGEREADIKKINLSLPPEEAVPDFIVSLQSLTDSAGMVLEDIRIRADENTSVSGNGNNIKMIDAAIKVSGTYPAFKILLSGLEKNIRVADIQSVNFGSDENSDGSALNFIINLKIYYSK